uniref:C-type lectin domain-containing protein n=1 Tax=Callorhinchus milii TaxID=7868 RepID=A0A4W3IWS2_CALMI
MFVTNVIEVSYITFPYTWLGGSDCNKEGIFVWTDGSPMDHTAWCPSEPFNANGKESCVALNHKSKLTFSHMYFNVLKRICKKQRLNATSKQILTYANFVLTGTISEMRRPGYTMSIINSLQFPNVPSTNCKLSRPVQLVSSPAPDSANLPTPSSPNSTGSPSPRALSTRSSFSPLIPSTRLLYPTLLDPINPPAPSTQQALASLSSLTLPAPPSEKGLSAYLPPLSGTASQSRPFYSFPRL